MKTKRKKETLNKGITLIALVITIIVLLILAAVSISTLTGENGILTKASGAQNTTKQATAREKVQMAVLASYGTDGKIDVNQLNENLARVEGIENFKKDITKEKLKDGVTVTVDGYPVTINENGTVRVNDNGGTENPPIEEIGITAVDIASTNDKSEFYGAIVTGYTCENSAGVNAWKIFYADQENIYLIADDYISYEYVPKGKGGSSLNQVGNEYQLYFTNILSDYLGSSDITDTRIKLLNNDYFTKGYTSTNENMKAVAYMLDTSVWSVFKNNTYADYVIGGPTIEMLMESYSQKHNVDYRAQASSSIGYQISGNGGTTWVNDCYGLDTSDNLYVISSMEKATAMWIASPSANDPSYVMYVTGIGSINYDNYLDNRTGFRPLVCLKSSVQLEKKSDGTYKIK